MKTIRSTTAGLLKKHRESHAFVAGDTEIATSFTVGGKACESRLESLDLLRFRLLCLAVERFDELCGRLFRASGHALSEPYSRSHQCLGPNEDDPGFCLVASNSKGDWPVKGSREIRVHAFRWRRPMWGSDVRDQMKRAQRENRKDGKRLPLVIATTGLFTREAVGVAEGAPMRVILVNGRELANQVLAKNLEPR